MDGSRSVSFYQMKQEEIELDSTIVHNSNVVSINSAVLLMVRMGHTVRCGLSYLHNRKNYRCFCAAK